MDNATSDFINSSAMFSEWRKTLRQDNAEGRKAKQELLKAMPSYEEEIDSFIDLLESKYAILSLATAEKTTLLSLPRVMDALEDIEPLSKEEKFTEAFDMFQYWKKTDISPMLAQHPIFWHAVHVQALAEGKIKGNISMYLSKREKDTPEQRVNQFLSRMGGQAERRGYSTLMVNDCRLSAVWWRGYIASIVATNSDEQEKNIMEFLHKNVALSRNIARFAVARLTLLCQPKLITALIIALKNNNRTTSLSEDKTRNKFFAQIGGHFHEYNTNFLSTQEIEKTINKLLHCL